MKGIPASLAALIEVPIAPESKARAMMTSTPRVMRSSIFAAWRVGSAFATLIVHWTSKPAAFPCFSPSDFRKSTQAVSSDDSLVSREKPTLRGFNASAWAAADPHRNNAAQAAEI
jgi:hypothetical protein